MRIVVLGAVFVLLTAAATGCDEENEHRDMLPAFDLAGPTSVVGDMAGQDLASAAPADMVTAPAPMTAAISVRDNFFTPADVTIARGGTVTWTWAGANPHTVTSGSGTPSGMFDSGVRTAGTFSFTFPSAGSFTYYCMVHGFAVMHGTVTVQ